MAGKKGAKRVNEPTVAEPPKKRAAPSRMNVLAAAASSTEDNTKSLLPEVDILCGLKTRTEDGPAPPPAPAQPPVEESIASPKKTVKTAKADKPADLQITDGDIDEKLALKRLKNREAAQKCRKKQKDTIFSLENMCQEQKKENDDLRKKIEAMRAELGRQKEALSAGNFLEPTFPELLSA